MTIAKQRLVQEGWSIAYCYQYVAQNGQRYDIWFVSAWEKLKNWMHSFEAIVAFLMDVLNMDDVRYLSNILLIAFLFGMTFLLYRMYIRQFIGQINLAELMISLSNTTTCLNLRFT